MRELHFNVEGQNIKSVSDLTNIVRGTDNYLLLVFHYDSEWKNTKRVISMYNSDGEQVNEVIKDKIPVSYEVAKGSMFYFELTGKNERVRIKTNRMYIEQT